MAARLLHSARAAFQRSEPGASDTFGPRFNFGGRISWLPLASSELPEKPHRDTFPEISKQIVVIIAILCPNAARIYMQIFISAHISIY